MLRPTHCRIIFFPVSPFIGHSSSSQFSSWLPNSLACKIHPSSLLRSGTCSLRLPWYCADNLPLRLVAFHQLMSFHDISPVKHFLYEQLEGAIFEFWKRVLR